MRRRTRRAVTGAEHAPTFLVLALHHLLGRLRNDLFAERRKPGPAALSNAVSDISPAQTTLVQSNVTAAGRDIARFDYFRP